MTELDSFEDYLLSKSSEEVLEIIHQFFDGNKAGFPEKINWDGFAFSASMKARGLDFDKPDLNWAKIAIKVYEFLANSSQLKNLFENSAMMLRSFMIFRLGHIDHDPILDSNNIMEWFIENLEFSYDEMYEKAIFWEGFFSQNIESKNPDEKVNFEEVRKLRHLKERLSIIRTLAEGENVILSAEIKRFLEFREHLP